MNTEYQIVSFKGSYILYKILPDNKSEMVFSSWQDKGKVEEVKKRLEKRDSDK